MSSNTDTHHDESQSNRCRNEQLHQCLLKWAVMPVHNEELYQHQSQMNRHTIPYDNDQGYQPLSQQAVIPSLVTINSYTNHCHSKQSYQYLSQIRIRIPVPIIQHTTPVTRSSHTSCCHKWTGIPIPVTTKSHTDTCHNEQSYQYQSQSPTISTLVTMNSHTSTSHNHQSYQHLSQWIVIPVPVTITNNINTCHND